MERVSAKKRYEFITQLQEHLPQLTSFRAAEEVGKKVLRLGATYSRLQEAYCNRELTPAEEKREQKIEAELRELLSFYNCLPVFSGDPRGHTIKIKLPDDYSDDWGKVGLCVPTS